MVEKQDVIVESEALPVLQISSQLVMVCAVIVQYKEDEELLFDSFKTVQEGDKFPFAFYLTMRWWPGVVFKSHPTLSLQCIVWVHLPTHGLPQNLVSICFLLVLVPISLTTLHHKQLLERPKLVISQARLEDGHGPDV